MKAVERRQHERLLSVWRTMLGRLNDMGPQSDAHQHLEAFGHVKDYILDRIEECEAVLHNATLLRPKRHGLPAKHNRRDNQLSSGVENAG